jgi:hypothetical protein
MAGYTGQRAGVTRGTKLPPRVCVAVEECGRPTYRMIIELGVRACRGHYAQFARGHEFKPLRSYGRRNV